MPRPRTTLVALALAAAVTFPAVIALPTASAQEFDTDGGGAETLYPELPIVEIEAEPFLDVLDIEVDVVNKLWADAGSEIAKITSQKTAGSENTTLFLTSLPQNSERYYLTDPWGFAVARNFSVDNGGHLEIQRLRLTEGDWTLYRDDAAVDAQLADVPDVANMTRVTKLHISVGLGGIFLGAIHGSPTMRLLGLLNLFTTAKAPPSETCGPATTKVGSEWLWTPYLVANSPYNGRTTASTSWSKATSVFLFAGGYTSEMTGGYGMSPGNGESRGLFTKAKWGSYRVDPNVCHKGDEYNTAKIDTPGSGAGTVALHGASTKSDKDNVQSYKDSKGIRSVEFKTRYYCCDFDRTAYGGAFTEGPIKETRLLRVSASVKIEGVSIGASHWTSKTNCGVSCASYSYTYNKGGAWHVDKQGGGSYAFDYFG